MANVTKHRKAVVKRVLEGPGVSTTTARRAAFHNQPDAPAHALLDKVVTRAWTITDEDVAAAKRELREDEVFELVACAAVGQATRQIEAALAAVEEVFE